jgi:hypothetical protein
MLIMLAAVAEVFVAQVERQEQVDQVVAVQPELGQVQTMVQMVVITSEEVLVAVVMVDQEEMAERELPLFGT